MCDPLPETMSEEILGAVTTGVITGKAAVAGPIQDIPVADTPMEVDAPDNLPTKEPCSSQTGQLTAPVVEETSDDNSLATHIAETHQRVSDRIETIVNDQLVCEEQTGQIVNDPIQLDDLQTENKCEPTEQDEAESSANDNPTTTISPSLQPIQMDQNVVIQYPNYKFEDAFELLNSGSLFSAEQYLDSCKWSPDGSCLLTCCADRRLRLFDLPSQLYEKSEFDRHEKLEGPLKPSLVVSENGAVYDYEWFPFMSSWQPETACFISASSSSPVHLIDAFTGTIRASYTGLNHVYEVSSCFGLIFSFDGAKIICGYRNMIKIFDVAVPGSTSQTLNTKKLNEQTGYISCIAQNPSMTCMFAAGSFSRTIGLYTTDGDAICLLKGQRNGLTSLVYSADGTKLFSGSRMDPEILCWDLRNPGQVLNVLPRVMETNQRIRISVSVEGQFLLSGGTDGVVRIWKLDEVALTPGTCEPHITFKAHDDCVNGVSLNRRFPVLATSSGKRHTPDLVSDEESEQIFSYKNFSKKTENRVSLWWVGAQKEGSA